MWRCVAVCNAAAVVVVADITVVVAELCVARKYKLLSQNKVMIGFILFTTKYYATKNFYSFFSYIQFYLSLFAVFFFIYFLSILFAEWENVFSNCYRTGMHIKFV